MLCDPETRLSDSKDVGFFGITGDEGLGELIDSGLGEGLGEGLGTFWDPDTLRSSSSDSGFLGGSGVEAFPKFPDKTRGDLAGVAGFSVDDCLAGVPATRRSSGFPLVLGGSELERTGSEFTKGRAVVAAAGTSS